MIGEKLVVLVSGADAQSTRGVEESRGIWHFAARQPNDTLVDGPHMQFRACGCVGAVDLDRDFLFWFDVVRHGESRFQGWFGSNGNPNMTLGSSGCPTVRILIEGSNQCGQQVDAAPGVLGHWDVNGGFGACHGHAL